MEATKGGEGVKQKRRMDRLWVVQTEDQVAGEVVLCCPLCKFEFNHLQPPRFESGQGDYDADWYGRGDLIVVPMECESGHKWELCIGEHKGNIFFFARKQKRSKTANPTAGQER